MKIVNPYSFIFLCIITCGCQGNKQQTNAADSTLFKDTGPVAEEDIRPAEQVSFLKRVKAESDFEVASDAIKKDTRIAAFNKYASDSLKSISGWEMIVTEINDDPLSSNTVMTAIGNGSPVYNVVLTAPVKIDRSVDSVAVDNRVDFTYSIPKEPTSDALKKQLAIIKTLSKGDVIIVSGSLTHLDDNGKVNFASFYDHYTNWNIDLLLTGVKKSATKSYQYLKHF